MLEFQLQHQSEVKSLLCINAFFFWEMGVNLDESFFFFAVLFWFYFDLPTWQGGLRDLSSLTGA